jgi:hypothetical protein
LVHKGSAALKAIEIAFERKWFNFWLEYDSSQVVAPFKSPKKPVTWPLRNKWKNAIFMMSHMNCIVTLIEKVTKLQTSLLTLVCLFMILSLGTLVLTSYLMPLNVIKEVCLTLDCALLNGVLVWSLLFVLVSLIF